MGVRLTKIAGSISMIGFIGTLITSFLITLNYNTVIFTIAHAVGFSVFSSLLAADFNMETTASNPSEVILLFRLQSLCTCLS
jgi:uncharacterized membrane protein YcfT